MAKLLLVEGLLLTAFHSIHGVLCMAFAMAEQNVAGHTVGTGATETSSAAHLLEKCFLHVGHS